MRRSSDPAPHARRSPLLRQTSLPVSSCAQISSLFAVYPWIGSLSRAGSGGRLRRACRVAGPNRRPQTTPQLAVRDHCSRMSDDRPSEVLGGLPRTRPHRRSEKRGAPAPIRAAPTPAARPAARSPRPIETTKTTRRANSAKRPERPAASPATPASPGATKRATPAPSRVRQPAQPPGTPKATGSRRPIPAGGADLIGSAVNVTAELAEMGISAGARALRGVVARLPRP